MMKEKIEEPRNRYLVVNYSVAYLITFEFQVRVSCQCLGCTSMLENCLNNVKIDIPSSL